MEWNVGTIMSIGLRVIAQRGEVERVGRRVIAHIALTEEIYSEVKVLLNKIVPELVGELSIAEAKAKVAPEPAPAVPVAPRAAPVATNIFENFLQPRQHDPRSRRGRPQFR
jgi:hypothetical protein